MTFDSVGCLLLTYFYFSQQQYISAVIIYNLTLNVNKKLLQIAMLEPSPYRIKIPRSFLEDLTQIISNDSLK